MLNKNLNYILYRERHIYFDLFNAYFLVDGDLQKLLSNFFKTYQGHELEAQYFEKFNTLSVDCKAEVEEFSIIFGRISIFLTEVYTLGETHSELFLAKNQIKPFLIEQCLELQNEFPV